MKAKILKRTVVAGERIDPAKDKGSIEVSKEDMLYLFKRELAEPADAEARKVCGVKQEKAAARSDAE